MVHHVPCMDQAGKGSVATALARTSHGLEHKAEQTHKEIHLAGVPAHFH